VHSFLIDVLRCIFQYYGLQAVTKFVLTALISKKGVAHYFIKDDFKSFDGNNEALKKLENWILDKIS